MSKLTLVSSKNIKFDDPIKTRVRESLGLPEALDGYWDIIDTYATQDGEPAELVLAHYNDRFDPYNRYQSPLRRVRGVIVDLATGAVVAESYGYTQSIPCYSAIEKDDNGDIVFNTHTAMYHYPEDENPEEEVKIKVGSRTFPKDTTRMFLGYEGVMVRIFKWKGQEFFSTHRRIDALKSYWGGGPLFYDMYKESNGPALNSFFGEEEYSPYCYIMLLANNGIRLATNTKENRILFVGVKKVWDEEQYSEEYPWKDGYEVKIPKFEEAENVPTFSNEPERPMLTQPHIDVDIANKYMWPETYASEIPDNGYRAQEQEIVVDYNLAEGGRVEDIYVKRRPVKTIDERLSGGDFLILYTQDQSGRTLVYEVRSVAYEYRLAITGGDPNRYHRFVSEMTGFTVATPAELSKYPRYALELDTPLQRQIYWWSLYHDAIAPIYKEDVDGFLSRYSSDVRRVANFIMTKYPSLLLEEDSPLNAVPERVRTRLQNLRDIAFSTRNRKQNTQAVLKSVLYQETGPSLYRLITSLKRIQRAEERKMEENRGNLSPSAK